MTESIRTYQLLVAEQSHRIDRLVAERDSEREARWKSEKALAAKDEAMSVLFKRLLDAGVDCSDLIP